MILIENIKRKACFAVAVMFVIGMMACSGKDTNSQSDEDSVIVDNADIEMKTLTVMKGDYKKVYNVADVDDKAAEYKTNVNKEKCFFVISKKEYRLYVYEVSGKDTALVAHYPVCYAKNKEDKTREGDCCTPHCRDMKTPFTISEIKDAASWEHDFGWGKVAAYGNYFMRLKLNGSQVPDNRSIGIHGSTNNAESVPGRDSEGCIRLRDADIISLHDKYASEGTNVYIKAYEMGKLPFEIKAEKALGNKYKSAKKGNPVLAKAGNSNAAEANDGGPTGKISGAGDDGSSSNHSSDGTLGPQGKIKD